MSQISNSKYPYGDLLAPRYDQSTYFGRLKHFLDITNPLNLFTSSEYQEYAKSKVLEYQLGIVDSSITERQYWKYANLTKATFHPDTNEKIFLPFRMSSYTLTNIPVVALMLIPNMSWTGIISSQLLNQTANVGFNYFNANKSSILSTKDILTGYAGAVGVSCSIAIGLNLLKSTGRLHKAFVPYITFFAVSMASTSNLLLMRQNELINGIKVFDSSGNEVGISKTAAKVAIGQTALSRLLASVPALVIPPTVVTFMTSRNLFKMHKNSLPRTILVNSSLVGLSFLFGLPVFLALFDQTCHMDSSKLEPEVYNSYLNLKSSGPVTFNRGL
eukprot:NODE_46_length_27655_cov_0.671796.p11 type:complete len:330 gc:universal NODE_46_length_27655_cov_0.671796:9782-8793(-)